MSLIEAVSPPSVDLAPSPGPPKLSRAELVAAQERTLDEPRAASDVVTRVLVGLVNLIYGRRGSLAKFKVLELLAPLPYQAWERVAYRALTRLHHRTTLARRVFDAVVEARAQQDNEAFHLLILEELLQAQGVRQGFVRHKLLPKLMATPYRLLCWALVVLRPRWSYALNANFEDHAEHEYVCFVADHPELEQQRFSSALAADYGSYDSVADVLRQIAHDERVHKIESLTAKARQRR